MDTKNGAKERLEQIQSQLIDLSHRIHAQPEIAFEEERSCRWVADMLDGNGFIIKPAAEKALLDGALAMAWTAIDMAQTPAVRGRLMRVG